MVDVIKIDPETQKELLQINVMINELQAKVQLICNTYLRAKGIDTTNGNLRYGLNQECTELAKRGE